MIDFFRDSLVKDVMTRKRVEVIKRSPNIPSNKTLYILTHFYIQIFQTSLEFLSELLTCFNRYSFISVAHTNTHALKSHSVRHPATVYLFILQGGGHYQAVTCRLQLRDFIFFHKVMFKEQWGG